MNQRQVYAFIVSNTSLTYRDIADMTDDQIGDVLEQFKQTTKRYY